MTTETIELIRTTERYGFNMDGVPIHRHTQLYTFDGGLVVELCDCEECDTLELPEVKL